MRVFLKNPPDSDGRFLKQGRVAAWPIFIEARQIGCPVQMVDAFLGHRHRADRRKIPFELTLTEWWNWWKTDDRWLNRGRGMDRFCMARKGDVGPYRINNIYCATNLQNIGDVDKQRLTDRANTFWAQRRKQSHAGRNRRDKTEEIEAAGRET